MASAVVSTVQPGSGSRPTRMLRPVSSWRASRRWARVCSRVRARCLASASNPVRQASGSVEMLPSVTSSGSRAASSLARSVVWFRRASSVQSGR